jgi:hypothetical protein
VQRVFGGGRGKNAGNAINKCIQNRLMGIEIYGKEGKEWIVVGIEEGICAKTFLICLCIKRKNFMMRLFSSHVARPSIRLTELFSVVATSISLDSGLKKSAMDVVEIVDSPFNLFSHIIFFLHRCHTRSLLFFNLL